MTVDSDVDAGISEETAHGVSHFWTKHDRCGGSMWPAIAASAEHVCWRLRVAEATYGGCRLPLANRAASLTVKGVEMPRTPNYDFERKERDRVKAAKKAEKLAAKAAKNRSEKPDESTSEAERNGRDA